LGEAALGLEKALRPGEVAIWLGEVALDLEKALRPGEVAF
jgi:hypothetical protein